VAAASGRSHALIPRYFGSKAGLELAVVERLAEDLTAAITIASRSTAPWEALLRVARRSPVAVHLVVRCGVGDLPIGPLLAPGGPGQVLAGMLGARPAGRAGGRRAEVCAFAALSLLLGWLSFDGFIIEAARLSPVSKEGRDAAVGEAVARVGSLAGRSHPPLRTRRRGPRLAPNRHIADLPPSGDARTALVESAVKLFALRGPAAVSVREIARIAGVNHGLVHRHFGSKEALVAEAIEHGSIGLFRAALPAGGFDLDAVVRQVRHESLAPVLIARTLVDDLDLARVRDRFPVVRRLVDAYRDVPQGRGTGTLDDPRLAVAAAVSVTLGSTIWDAPLRAVTGISNDVDLDAAVADIARHLLQVPHAPNPLVRSEP
jgi:AcrR family transcriptional regulator